MSQEEENLDQSVFSLTQEEVLAPPETILSAEEQVKADIVHKKKVKIMILVGGAILLMISLSVVMGIMMRTVPETIIYPTPTPPPIKDFTKMEEELSRLEYITRLANPNEDTLPLPPVDEQLSL